MTAVNAGSTSFNPKDRKYLTILMGAVLFGFGWQIRGSGSSDPSVVILLFLLFLSVHYSPRQKFNVIVFAVAVFVFTSLRTGWGTFVAQAGIPGLYPGHIPPNYGEGYDIVVPWWQGYFWLFIVGISWAGIPALIFGGYFFTTHKYTVIDALAVLVLFFAGTYVSKRLVVPFIPLIAPHYYHEIYLTGLSTRNYVAMVDNMSKALAIIPVLLYVWLVKKDAGFVKRSAIVMSIFGIGLAVADIWQAVGRNNPQWTLPEWSLWEYTSGFLIGGQLFWYFSRFSEEELQASDISPGLERVENLGGIGRFIVYSVALYYMIVYGLQQSIAGSLKRTFDALHMSPMISAGTLRMVLVGVMLVGCFLYQRGIIGASFARKSFREKCVIALVVLLPIYYVVFAMRHIVSLNLFQLKVSHSAVWLDTISFAIAEVYAIYLYTRFRSVSSARAESAAQHR